MRTKSKPEITGSGFEFVDNGHAYYLDGVKMTGVTTVLAVIAKPQLIQWATNMAAEYVQKKIIDCSPGLILESLPAWLVEAKTAHRKTKESAGDWGSIVHKAIEVWIATKEIPELVTVKKEGFKVEEAHKVAINHFIKWATDNNVKFLASEEKVFSRELFVGGTIDFIGEIDGEVWIGDIKTSSAIYPEHFFQVAAYQKLMEDMAETDEGMMVNVKGHVVLNCRKDGSFEEKRSISNEDARAAFLAALTIKRITDKLQGNII